MLRSPIFGQTRTISVKVSADEEEFCDFPLPPQPRLWTSSSPSSPTSVKIEATSKTHNDNRSSEQMTSPEASKERGPEVNSKKSSVAGSYRISGNIDTDLLLLAEEIDCLKIRLDQERRTRVEEAEIARKAIRQMYTDFNSLVRQEKASLQGIESKVDTLITKYRNCQHEAHTSHRKFQSTIDTVSKPGYRIDAVERHDMSVSSDERSYSDTLHTRNDYQGVKKSLLKRPWSAQVVFVLDADRPNVFEVDGIAYLKIQSRRPSQKVNFSDNSSAAFTEQLDAAFPSLLQHSRWMPLARNRVVESDQATHRIALDRLPLHERSPDLWTRHFLEDRCITYDMSGNAHIYICLQEGKFEWKAIDALLNDANLKTRAPLSPVSTLHPKHWPFQEDDRPSPTPTEIRRNQDYHLSIFNSCSASDRPSSRNSIDSNGFTQQHTGKLPPPSPREALLTVGGNAGGRKTSFSPDSSATETWSDSTSIKKKRLKLSRRIDHGRRRGAGEVTMSDGGDAGGARGGWLGRLRHFGSLNE